MKKCLVCSRSVSGRSPKAKYCSTSCKYKAYRRGISQKTGMKKPCAYCGKMLIVQSDKKYCNQKCNERAWNERKPHARQKIFQRYRINSGRSKTIWTPNKINTCTHCKEPFKPGKMQPWQKYCSNCAHIRDRKKTYAWKNRNPDAYKETQRKFWKSPKGKILRSKNNARRRFKVKPPTNKSSTKYLRILKAQKGRCALCQNESKRLEFDHIIAVHNKEFGWSTNEAYNIMYTCVTCNRTRQNKDIIAWCEENDLDVPKRVIECYMKFRQQNIL